jgi:hypothetical protein
MKRVREKMTEMTVQHTSVETLRCSGTGMTVPSGIRLFLSCIVKIELIIFNKFY